MFLMKARSPFSITVGSEVRSWKSHNQSSQLGGGLSSSLFSSLSTHSLSQSLLVPFCLKTSQLLLSLLSVIENTTRTKREDAIPD